MRDLLSEENERLLEDFRNYASKGISKSIQLSIGDTIIAKVNGIEDYGVFITGNSGIINGLIHITNMSKNIVDDFQNYFKIGMDIHVTVVGINKGKYSFVVADENELFQLSHESNIIEYEKNNKDFEQVVELLQSYIGIVSEEARVEIKDTIEEIGLVKFMVKFMKSIDTFKHDASLAFVNHLKKKDDLL